MLWLISITHPCRQPFLLPAARQIVPIRTSKPYGRRVSIVLVATLARAATFITNQNCTDVDHACYYYNYA
jgi:hypothetical protein